MKNLTLCSGSYLEHVCVVIVAVLHHHGLVTGQSERDAVLPPAVDGLQRQQVELMLANWGRGFYFPERLYAGLSYYC